MIKLAVIFLVGVALDLWLVVCILAPLLFELGRRAHAAKHGLVLLLVRVVHVAARVPMCDARRLPLEIGSREGIAVIVAIAFVAAAAESGRA